MSSVVNVKEFVEIYKNVFVHFMGQ